MCYSFNLVLEYEQENVSSSNSDGPDYGLSLVIDIEKSQYMRRGMSTKEGVIIALASKSQSPNLLASPLQICKCITVTNYNSFLRVIGIRYVGCKL